MISDEKIQILTSSLELIQFVIMCLLRIKSRDRRMYIRPILKGRYSQGEYTNLVQEMRLGDREYHYTYFRMSASNFEKLYTKVGPLIEKKPTHAYPISAGARLAMTLRYLAHGDSQQSLGFSYRVHKSSVCNIISETCKAIGDVLFHEVLVEPKSECEWLNISKDFMNQWNFPNCLGAIDGKHIVIQAPANSGSLFFNYKKTFSIVLMAICDANYKFILVDIGCPGRNSDGGVFSNTSFYKALEHNKLNIPPPNNLSDDTTRAPFVFVGDEAFPLKRYMMRPYPRKDLTDSKRIFNYRLSRARRVIENAFGILATKWRIFMKPIHAQPEKVVSIVKACLCLHNFVREEESVLTTSERRYCSPSSVDQSSADGSIVNGAWRDESVQGLQRIGPMGSNMYGDNANTIRENFTSYFMSESGQIPWQYQAIN